MKLSVFIPGILILTSASLIVACAGKHSSSAPAPIACPAGQVNTPDGQSCVATAAPGIPPGTKVGFYAQSVNFQQYFPQYRNNGSILNLGTGMKTILKHNMAVCDREEHTCGQASCDTWEQGVHDIVVIFDGSTANQGTLLVRSYPKQNPFFNYSCNLPSLENFFLGALTGINLGNTSAVQWPLKLTTTIAPTNGSQGFELRANGPSAGAPFNNTGWWRLLQFKVMNGKIEDPTIQFRLLIDGGNQQMVEAMTGTMVRCNEHNCGVQGL